jgi:hypothetical protein
MFLGYSDTKAQDVQTYHFKVTESPGKVVGTTTLYLEGFRLKFDYEITCAEVSLLMRR